MTDQTDVPRPDNPGGAAVPAEYLGRVLGAVRTAVQRALDEVLGTDPDEGAGSVPEQDTPTQPARPAALTCGWCPDPEHPEPEHHPAGSGNEHIARRCVTCGNKIRRILPGGGWHHVAPADHGAVLAPMTPAGPPATVPVDVVLGKAQRFDGLIARLTDMAHNDTGSGKAVAESLLLSAGEALPPDPERRARLAVTHTDGGVDPDGPAGALTEAVNEQFGPNSDVSFDVIDAENAIEALRERGYRIVPNPSADVDGALSDLMATFEACGLDPAIRIEDGVRRLAEQRDEADARLVGARYARDEADARAARATARARSLRADHERVVAELREARATIARLDADGPRVPVTEPVTTVYHMITGARRGDPVVEDRSSGPGRVALRRLVAGSLDEVAVRWVAAEDLAIGQRVVCDVERGTVAPVGDPDVPDLDAPVSVTEAGRAALAAEWPNSWSAGWPHGWSPVGWTDRDGLVTETTRPGGHVPTRGSDVEAWIKRARGQWGAESTEWVTLDDLLDDYRAHADMGTPLDLDAEPCGTCAGRGCPDCREEPVPEVDAGSLGESPHDAEHCDEAGRPHLGPCVEPPARAVGFTEDNDEALASLVADAGLPKPGATASVSLTKVDDQVRLSNDGPAVVRATVGDQFAVLERGDSIGLNVPVPVVPVVVEDKPKPAASLMPAGLAEGRVRVMTRALAGTPCEASALSVGMIVQRLDELGWAVVPHSLGQRYAGIDPGRLAGQVAERLPVLFERVSEDPGGGVAADESYHPLSAGRTAELVEGALREVVRAVAPDAGQPDPVPAQPVESPADGRHDRALAEVFGGVTAGLVDEPTPHEHDHPHGNAGGHHHHGHAHGGAQPPNPGEWSYVVPADVWLGLDNEGRNARLAEARQQAVAQYGPDVVRTWEYPTIERRTTPHGDDAVYITWKINERQGE